MNQLTETAASIALAIVGVAILAVILSRQSNTVGVLGALSGAFSNALGVAVSPVTGAPTTGLGGIPSLNLGGYYSGGVGY